MKKIFLLISILLFITLFAPAQVFNGNIFPLPADTIPQKVVLGVESFRSDASVASETPVIRTMAAQENLHPHIPNSATISTSYLVGEIPLQHQVSPSGATMYSIPVQCLPGRNGTQPQVSLVYSNTNGNGPVGYGWTIGGLSFITRTGSSMYYDQGVKPVDFAADGPFSLDGNRLICIERTATKNMFEPEQGHTKVEAFLTGGRVKYFKVWYPNGATGIFGYENETADKLAFPLTRFTDAQGNIIDYKYTYTNNQYYVSEISYGGNIYSSTTPYAYILFTYKARPAEDVMKMYMAGLEITEDKLLDKITTKSVALASAKTYTLTYSSPVSLLNKVDFTTEGGRLNPLYFHYGNNHPNYGYIKRTSRILEWFNSTNVNDLIINKGKFDPWSDDDALIAYPNKHPYVETIVESGIFHHSQRYYSNMFHPDQDLLVYPDIQSEWISPVKFKAEEGFMELTSGDIDEIPGDEVIKINNVVVDRNDRITFKLYKPYSVGTYLPYKTVSFDPMPALEYRGRWSITPKTFCIGDFTGIGRMQVLAVSRNNPLRLGNSTQVMLIDLHESSMLYQSSSTGIVLDGGNEHNDLLFGIDFDGDGKTDICHIHNTGTDIYTFNGSGNNLTLSKIASIDNSLNRVSMEAASLLIGDINGDGKTDFLLSPQVGGGSNWTAFYSKGKGGFQKSTHSIMAYNRNNRYLLQDIDNDGKGDLIQYNTSRMIIDIYPGIANGFSTTSRLSFSGVSPGYMIPTIVSKQSYHNQLLVMGNSTLELINFTKDQTRDRMLSASVNSLGVIIKADYRKLNEDESGFFTTGYGAVFPYENFSGPLYATTATQVWYRSNKKEDLSYNYQNALIHKQGLGFLGFERFSAIDRVKGRTSSLTCDPIRYGIPVREATSVSVTESTYNISVAANKKATIRLNEQRTTDLLNGNVAMTTYRNYDLYGHPGKIMTDYGSGIRQSTEITYQHTNGSSRYALGIPLEEKNISERDNELWENRTVYTYNDKGQMTGETGFINNGQVTRKQYEYNQVGNLTRKSIQQYNSQEVLQTEYRYDSYGFLQKEIDPMNLETTYTYNQNFGRLSSMETPFISENYTYDGLDRVIRISRSTSGGQPHQIIYKWETQNSDKLYSVTYIGNNPEKTIYYDAFNREVQEKVKGLSSQYFHTDRVYDAYGRLEKVSDPYFSGTPQYTLYSYDAYDRITRVARPGGGVTTTLYGQNTVTVNDNGLTSVSHYDAAGNMVRVVDPAGEISYHLRADGQPHAITAPNGAVTSFEYDAFGRQTKIIDPSAGTIQYSYNDDGLLYRHTNARGHVNEYFYNRFGQVIEKRTPELTVNYGYSTRNYLLESITAGDQRKTYTYDRYGRILTETEQVGNISHGVTYYYSGENIYTVTYSQIPDLKLFYSYENGHLKTIQWNGRLLYSLIGINSFGQTTSRFQSNGITTEQVYTPEGLPQSIVSKKDNVDLQRFTYAFDGAKKLLTQRKDVVHNKTEYFDYDQQKRLISYGFPGKDMNVQYNGMGSILSKTDAGTLFYENTDKPYQVTSQEDFPLTVSPERRSVSYTSFERPKTIAVKGGDSAVFTYGHDLQRHTMKMYTGDHLKYTRYYLGGNYERTEYQDGTIREFLYMNGTPYTATAVNIRTNGGDWELRYIHRDHLGSIVALSDALGNMSEEIRYDAWGRTRYAESTETGWINNTLGRGFTGHEMLPEFGLINMNARLYDPVLGQFLAPDPYVQSPGFSQSFNRYGYAWNNPLVFVDEDGEFIILAAVLVGAAIGTWQGYKIGKAHGATGWSMAGYMLGGAAIGGLAGGVSAGAGILAGGYMAGMGLGGFTAGATTGAVIGATNGLISGYGIGLLAGASHSEALAMGGKNAWVGALSGAALSGSIQGVVALKNHMNFWTGRPIATGRGAFSLKNTPVKAETPSIKLDAPKKPEINTDGLRSRPNTLPDEPSFGPEPVKFGKEIDVNLGGELRYYRGGNSMEMSKADMYSSVTQRTGLMKSRGISLNSNPLDANVQKYGGAWEVNTKTIPKGLQIIHTSGTHFEIAPSQAGMTLQNYQNLLKQIQVLPFNRWSK